MRYYGMDIEVDGLAGGVDPLHPTCIGVASIGKGLTIPKTAAYPGLVSPLALVSLIEFLWDLHQDPEACIVTFNGTGFDWPILAENAPECSDMIKEMALQSIDLMLIVLAQKGFPVGLDAMARAMLGEGKTGNMDGADAPLMWLGSQDLMQMTELETKYKLTPGSVAARELLLKYVLNDARLTAKLAHAIEQTKQITWITKKDRYSSFPLFMGKDLTSLRVGELYKLPTPDTSWMTHAPVVTIESATEWLRADA